VFLFILPFSGATGAPVLIKPTPSPSTGGLDIKLKAEDQVEIEFDLEIKGPDPQAILDQIQQSGGSVK